MYELQSLKDFIQNPMGKGVSLLPTRDIIVDDYKRRYKLQLDKNKKFEMQVYKAKGDKFYVHIKVPSESLRQNKYDVVFEFEPSGRFLIAPRTIDSYLVRFFSNCPSFVFTYANLMIEHDMIVKCLKNKYSKDVIKKKAIVHNPTGTIMYEKSIMFAAIHLLEDDRNFNREYLLSIAKPFDAKMLGNEVQSEQDVLEEIKKENRRIGLEKKEEKEKLDKKVRAGISTAKKNAGVEKHSSVRVIKPKQSLSSNSSSKSRVIKPKKSTRRK